MTVIVEVCMNEPDFAATVTVYVPGLRVSLAVILSDRCRAPRAEFELTGAEC